MDGTLQFVEGPEKGRAIPFADGKTIRIGRGAGADVQITDPYASRMHCQIDVVNGLVTVADLGSSCGTLVNGAKIAGKQIVMPGDHITIGSTKLLMQYQGSSEDRTVNLPLPVMTPQSAATTLQTLPEDASLLEGASIADYTLGKIIATGVSGIIYRGSKKGAPAVALKVFHREFSKDVEAKLRFLRAARTMLDLRHPNLVSILEAGETGVFCWVAMELVEGDSLAKVIQRIGIAGILDWRHGLRVGIHVARGLEFAQKHAVVHRNIKPSNILIRSSDNFAKLGDLVLAKALEGTRAQEITNPGSLLGDLLYSSPERAHGKPVDGRSDLYELGATVYALLTGQPPFQGRSLVQVARALESEAPPSPKRVQLSIPDAFDAVVLRLLAKDPAQRYQTPTELLATLEQLARAEKVSV